MMSDGAQSDLNDGSVIILEETTFIGMMYTGSLSDVLHDIVWVCCSSGKRNREFLAHTLITESLMLIFSLATFNFIIIDKEVEETKDETKEKSCLLFDTRKTNSATKHLSQATVRSGNIIILIMSIKVA